MHASLLAVRYPAVSVEPDSIFVRDRNVWTSAGVTSDIDRALALIEQDAGREVAINVARILVVYLKRAGGQSQCSALLAAQAQSNSDIFSELERWIAEHLKEDLPVEALAERVNMSPRNFARVYGEARGRTPGKAVEAIELTQRAEGSRKRGIALLQLPRIAGSATKSRCERRLSERSKLRRESIESDLLQLNLD